MARGGRRSGTPGTAYNNRTDLNQKAPIARIPGQPYGAQAAQVAAQQAIPVAAPPVPGASATGGFSVHPSMVPGLLEPTQRPNEPVTTQGETQMMVTPKPGVDDLAALYEVFRYPGIKKLLDQTNRLA